VELQVFFEELFAGMPSFRLDPAHSVTYDGGIVVGPNAPHLL
jgi:hypothetical protein